MLAIGWSAFQVSWPAAVASVLLLWVFAAKVRLEERALSARFGGEYDDYRRSVGAVFSLRKKLIRR